MAKYFITYGDEKFKNARNKIVSQALAAKQFDKVIAYGRKDLSKKLLNSEIINVPRGGGLWSWKPDVILKTMETAKNGDIIIYCDSGCTVQPSREWQWYWDKLEKYDIIAQRMYNRTEKWTRKELLDYFSGNGNYWTKCYQYQATISLKVTDFTRNFVKEWLDIMLQHPVFAMDVTDEERPMQHKELIANRHDQAIYSALIYKYLKNGKTKSKIYTTWERIEDLHPFRKQAIRATRLRQGEEESEKERKIKIIKRLIKEYVLYPLVYTPQQYYFWKINNVKNIMSVSL